MNIKDLLGKRTLFFDGGMGTMLQANGLGGGDIPELYNITHSDLIEKIHSEYLSAGADIITTNTFGANAIHEAEYNCSLEEVINSAVAIAKRAVSSYSTEEKPRFVALDIGPTGKMLQPLGDLSFDDAYDIFARTAIIGEKAGADLVIIETMSDTLEIKAALLAVKENTNLPVFCTMTFDESGKALTGASPEVMVAMLEGLGADCIGINCGLGPDAIYKLCEKVARVVSVPFMAQPNAGLPVIENGKTVFNVTPEQFAEDMAKIAQLGASVLGGCCGTTPMHIRLTAEKCADYIPKVEEKPFTVITSYSEAVYLDNRPIIVGERINPTGKKKFKQALIDGDINYILAEAVKQKEAGAHVLDVNVGLPEIDEKAVMETAVKKIQETVSMPLQIDSSEAVVLERAMRVYNGKPMVNSVNGKEEVMHAVFPLVKKYGGVLVGLALDEEGIPEKAEDRFKIAEKIVATAENYGINRKNIVIDALTLTISAQQKESAETVKAIKLIKEKLGVKTILGVSNISFGLPRREIINSTFFGMALMSGLDACIINPCTDSMMDTYRAYRALACIDESCTDYIAAYTGTKAHTVTERVDIQKEQTNSPTGNPDGDELFNVIVKGLRDMSYDLTMKALESMDTMEIINKVLVGALDVVGAGFEKGTMFLPQLMMSAETVKNAFGAIKEYIEKSGIQQESKGRIVIATVKGDIHDIGKNIVRVLLENYGYDVIDLGKDVAPEIIVETLKRENIKLCGLSALMTTTVLSMEQTIKAIREAGLDDVKVMVGGAVLNQQYADMIGADFYGKDALATVNYANSLFVK